MHGPLEETGGLPLKVDAVAAGFPLCLKIIAAVATMVKDADKLAMG